MSQITELIAPESHHEPLAPESSQDPVNSEGADQGLDTHSSLVQSETASDHENSNSEAGNHNSEHVEGNAPDSSRGSTKATGEDDNLSFYSRAARPFIGRDMWEFPHAEEQEKEDDGSPILTNRYLRELLRKEYKKYYRTAYLNEKLFLHYKGFHYLRNLEQFTELRCLYFEGNGCVSLTGLEQNTQLRSLFIMENCIENIEGLDTLKELRQLNLNDNMIRKIGGLAECDVLDTLYVKNNRLGQDQDGGDVASIEGLLERPTLTCIDLQGNYLTNVAIFEEVIFKMPQLKVVYLMGNKACNQLPNYRKTMTARLPNLLYLDDRPVFEDDRRKAIAFARGGIDAEREEIKIIRKEKEDKHWANHEAFQLMIKNAKEEKKQDEATKESKKTCLKEMMAKAKLEREKDSREGVFQAPVPIEENKKFYGELNDKIEQRYNEKQANIEHDENVDWSEVSEVRKQDIEINREKAKEYDELYIAEVKRGQEHVTLYENREGQIEIEEIHDEEEEEEQPPELEEVDEETRKLEEIEKMKKQKQQEWFDNVVKESEKSKAHQSTENKENEPLDAGEEKENQSDNQSEKSMIELEDILMDENKVRDAMKTISGKDIKASLENQAKAVLHDDQNELDELD